MNEKRSVFVTGGTGYLGSQLVPQLLSRGHDVRALVRPGSENKVSKGCTAVLGNALDPAAYSDRLRPSDTFVHLVGVPKPNPWKGKQFRAVDLVAASAAINAAKLAGVAHFVYVSVAHPAPVMRSYIAVRVECEEQLHASGLNATILRPWYIVGPGHRWPTLLIPAYSVAEWFAPTREGALRLGLVSLAQMIAALVSAVENPAQGVRIIAVPEIRSSEFHSAGVQLSTDNLQSGC